MNKDQKLLFFDIDGTLLTAYPWTIPDSTQQALKAARKNGHLLFINSGRTYTMLPDMIREMNFDGYVCGCGSQIYLHDKLLLSSSIPNPLCREIVERLRKSRLPACFERPDKILYDSSSCDLPDAIQKLKKVTITEDISLYTTQKYENFTFDKFLVFPTAESDRQEFRKFADQHFTCFVHEDAAWELAQKSHSKATGIQFLADYLGASIENTYAFGDSTNDLPMLKYAKTSIAMGNSDP